MNSKASLEQKSQNTSEQINLDNHDFISRKEVQGNMILTGAALILITILSVLLAGSLLYTLAANQQLEGEIRGLQQELSDNQTLLQMAQDIYKFDERELAATLERTTRQERTIFVFFDPDLNTDVIFRLRDGWEEIEQIERVVYTSSEQAFQNYSMLLSEDDYISYQILENSNNQLPASLDVVVRDSSQIQSVLQKLRTDVNSELQDLGIEDNVPIQIRLASKN